jgi:hypothetical protein
MNDWHDKEKIHDNKGEPISPVPSQLKDRQTVQCQN